MPDFNGFVGASVLPRQVWTKVGDVSPLIGDMFTVNITMVYSPGFLSRPINDPPHSVFTKNEESEVMELTDGPDDDVIVYFIVAPDGLNTNDLANVQPYLKASRYALEAGAVRDVSGVMIPAGWYVYAYASKSDVTVNIFGVEGKPTRFKRAS